ncbi:calcium-binding protein [Nocardioides psychrotolerans]|nr:hypothetical protein [Nocardioides psychrotolerans]
MTTSRSRRTTGLLAPLLLAVLAPVVPAADAAQAGAVPPTCHGERATLVGTDGRDVLVGTPRHDVIVARRGDDVVRAGGGDDLVCAGPGADVLWGGPGNDRLHGEGDRAFEDQGGPGIAGDTLRGGPGDDLLDVGFHVAADTGNFPNTLAWDQSAGPVRMRLGAPGDAPGVVIGEGRDRVVGARRLTVVGSRFGDVLDVRVPGDVKVVAGAGADRVRTGAGDDEVLTERQVVDHAVGDRDLVFTGAGDDQVSSFSGPDEISLGHGTDLALTASDAPVIIDGGAGGDQINATVHDDLIIDGGTGNNSVVLDATGVEGELVLTRRQGTLATGTILARVRRFTSYDLIGGSAWTYSGADLPDRVVALSSGGPVQVFTLGGDDELWGSPFDDQLDGGPGTDEVHPGGGADTCVSVEVGTCP